MPNLPEGKTLPARPGDRVAHFEIAEQIGSGGMGVVYRAVDLNLDRRQVALKCPWPQLVRDRDLVRRFLREIRIESQLSHPHIVPVYEAFEANGLPWLVMQFVKGASLDKILSGGRLPVEKVLRYTEQVASALESAHEAGVLHRDISPKNVIIAEDDRAYVTDFGLAKVLAQKEPDPTASTQSLSFTPLGAVLGTLPYMSPEQVLRKPLDERSDIFSLGSTVYEMCTGARAFSASGTQSLVDVIIHRQPEAISRFTYEVPEELERIVRKCLAKHPEERYQKVTDLIVDVRNLRRELQFKEYSDSITVAGKLAPFRWWTWVLALATLVAMAALVKIFFFGDKEPLASAVPIRITQGESWEGSPAISPDGKHVAYVSNHSGSLDIFVTAVSGGEPLRLTENPGADSDPAWVPDGSALIYVSDQSGQQDVWKIGPYGGQAVLYFPNARNPEISPNGTRLAFVRMDSTGMDRVAVVPLDDLSQVKFLSGSEDGLWHHANPAWSPDGKMICYQAEDNLWVIPAEGGKAYPLILQDGDYMEPVWSPDGRRIYFSSYGDQWTLALWWVPSGGGIPRRFTLGTGGENHPSFSESGLRMAYSTGVSESSIRLMKWPDGDPIHSGFRNCWMPALSPKGDWIVFVTARWGPRADLWIQALQDGNPVGQARRLFEDPRGNASHPAFSSDGEWIAYYRILGESRDIWTIPVRGGPPIRFTEDPSTDVQPAWSPDDYSIAFASEREGTFHIWIAPVKDGKRTGPAVRLTGDDQPEMSPTWSPDGRWIAYIRMADVWLAPVDRSEPPRRVTRDHSAIRVHWFDGETLFVTGSWESSSYAIRRVSVATGIYTTLPSIEILGYSPLVIMFDVSQEGGLLAFTKEDLSGDVWILNGEAGN